MAHTPNTCHGITILPMTEVSRQFVFGGIASQWPTKNLPYLKDKHVGRVNITRFAQSEIQVTVDAKLRGRDVYILPSYEPPINERVMEYYITLQVVHDAGARRITSVFPYFYYARGDKQDQHHGSVAAKNLAANINLYGSNVITCDLHDPIIRGFFAHPSCNLSMMANPTFMDAARTDPSISIVVATDANDVKRATRWADTLFEGRTLGRVVIDKQRLSNNGTATAKDYFGPDVAGKNVLIVDDEFMTGGTMFAAARILKAAGANKLYAKATHGILAGTATDDLVKSTIDTLDVTNTAPIPQYKVDASHGKLHVIHIEAFIMEAIRRWHANRSLIKLIGYTK